MGLLADRMGVGIALAVMGGALIVLLPVTALRVRGTSQGGTNV